MASTMHEAIADAMVDLWVFAAESGIFTPAIGDPVSVMVRIDRETLTEPDGLEMLVVGEEIRAKALLAEVGQEPVARTPSRIGDSFTVGSTVYEVTAIVEKDNHFVTCAVKER
jgi:hypothetical protein